MSLLVIKLPPRERLGARPSGSEGPAGLRLPAQWTYLLSPDGTQAGPLRQAPVALLPKADSVVLALAETDVSWHRVLIPKAAAARMPAALAGVLEERLLDDEESVHLALAPDAVPGEEGWVAATHGPRLTAALAALEAVGPTVDRVVCLAAPPGPRWRGHFSSTAQAADAGADSTESGAAGAVHERGVEGGGEPMLCLSRDDGVWCLPLAEHMTGSAMAGPAAGLAAALRGSLVEGAATSAQALAQTRWTATPAAALAAERFLGRPVALQTEAEHLLEAAQAAGAAAVNLRQFGLSARNRGMRAVGDVGKRLFSAEWRLVRWGLMALLGLQLVGLNAYAWQQRQLLQSKRAAVEEVLRTAHPGVRTVLDAPAQMAAETDRLRAAAGQPGGGDLEVALAAAAAAWPEGKGPVANLRYENGSLTLAAPGWQPAEVAALRERLRAGGWGVEFSDARLVLSRLRSGGLAP